MSMHSYFFDRTPYFSRLLQHPPTAAAEVTGSEAYPDLNGRVLFYPTAVGVLVSAQFFGLPAERSDCSADIFAFHIHSGTSCTGSAEDPFADALTHYSPDDCEHPGHAGDLPPLFGNQGYAFAQFLTDRFTVPEIVGRAVIVHRGHDDFTTQPAGNSGEKIACGIIEAVHS